MGKRGPESYMKRQKELKRKQKAQEKMARRQGKKMQQSPDAEQVAVEGDIPMEPQGLPDDQAPESAPPL
jgi:hypothetical protein